MVFTLLDPLRVVSLEPPENPAEQVDLVLYVLTLLVEIAPVVVERVLFIGIASAVIKGDEAPNFRFGKVITSAVKRGATRR